MSFTQVVFSICLLTASLVMILFVLLIRSLPVIAKLAVNILRFLLRWSYRLYSWIFKMANPFIQNQLGIDVMQMPFRLILSVVISLLIGLLLMLICKLQLTWIYILVFALHGVSIAWLWTDFFESPGLQIGEKI